MKKLLSTLLVTAAAFGFTATGAFADDDDDKECWIKEASVEGDTLFLMGKGMLKKNYHPVLFLSDIELEVSPGATSDVIEATSDDLFDLDAKSYVIKLFRKGVKINDDDDDDDEDRKLKGLCPPFEVAAIGPQGPTGVQGMKCQRRSKTSPKGGVKLVHLR